MKCKLYIACVMVIWGGFVYAKLQENERKISLNHGPREWQELYTVRHESIIKSVTFSPNGKIGASASSDGTIFIIDVKKGEILHTIKHNGTIHAAVFSRDSKVLVTASEDTTAKIIDVKTGEELYTVQHDSSVVWAVFSPRDNVVITASSSGEVKIIGFVND